jgi:Peptidase C13 family
MHTTPPPSPELEPLPPAVMAESIDPPAQIETKQLPMRGWFNLGQRVAALRAIDVGSKQISAIQFAGLIAILVLIELALSRWEIESAAQFNIYAWLSNWISLPLTAIFTWWALQRDAQRKALMDEPATTPHHAPPVHLGTFLGVSYAASIPVLFISMLFAILSARSGEATHATWIQWVVYVAWWAVMLWSIAISYWVCKQFHLGRRATVWIVLGSTAISLATSYLLPHRPFEADDSGLRGKAPQTMQLNQQLFEHQTALLQNNLAQIAKHREGTRELYAVVFAPYASENVFLNEAKMVSSVLNERFDTQDRLVQLVNHTNTTATVAWATPLNLERTINALAQKMDKEEDVLLMYLTSHGANDFKLAASHWPLDVPNLTPTLLAKMLDDAGIRHRVLIISACYAGGWLPALSNDYSLVMTAADATHTSYGCGHKSELTYFGRALFDEQLRNTFSFEEAFQKAVPVIQQRETEGGKTDGFSNPQISMGVKAKAALDELALRLQSLGK